MEEVEKGKGERKRGGQKEGEGKKEPIGKTKKAASLNPQTEPELVLDIISSHELWSNDLSLRVKEPSTV